MDMYGETDLSTVADAQSDKDFLFVTGDEEIRQYLAVDFRTLLGEWFLDPLVGRDWLRFLGKKGASSVEVSQMIRKDLQAFDYVTIVNSVNASMQGTCLLISFRVNQTITINDFNL